MRFFAAACLALAALDAGANEVPTRYPSVDAAQAAPAIGVARVRPGAALPDLDECTNKPDVVCMLWPFWFHAEILAVVSGQASERTPHVATLSHYGLASFVQDPAPRLLVLRTRGGDVVIPHNLWTTLAERRDGEMFLVYRGSPLPHWLPCSTLALREPLDETAFAPSLGAPRVADSDAFEGADVDGHPDAWHVVGEHAFPRFGVRITRLRELIADLAARHEPTDCELPREPACTLARPGRACGLPDNAASADSGAGEPMSDPHKYLLGATATIVAARIAARAQERSGGDLQKPTEPPALKDEFIATYRELEQAFDALAASDPPKPYSEKKARANANLLGD